jgi:hypothetical protein
LGINGRLVSAPLSSDEVCALPGGWLRHCRVRPAALSPVPHPLHGFAKGRFAEAALDGEGISSAVKRFVRAGIATPESRQHAISEHLFTAGRPSTVAADAGQRRAEGRALKKLLKPAGKRGAATYVMGEYYMSERHACRLIGVARSHHRSGTGCGGRAGVRSCGSGCWN